MGFFFCYIYGQYPTCYTEFLENTENPEYLYGKHGNHGKLRKTQNSSFFCVFRIVFRVFRVFRSWVGGLSKAVLLECIKIYWECVVSSIFWKSVSSHFVAFPSKSPTPQYSAWPNMIAYGLHGKIKCETQKCHHLTLELKSEWHDTKWDVICYYTLLKKSLNGCEELPSNGLRRENKAEWIVLFLLSSSSLISHRIQMI